MRASTATATVGGRPVVFRGTVAAAPGELPPGGATVQLQFRAAGLRWTEFRSVRTDPRGRFRYPYRFSDDDSRGIRFRFRALVPAQNDLAVRAGDLGAGRRARALNKTGPGECPGRSGTAALSKRYCGKRCC